MRRVALGDQCVCFKAACGSCLFSFLLFVFVPRSKRGEVKEGQKKAAVHWNSRGVEQVEPAIQPTPKTPKERASGLCPRCDCNVEGCFRCPSILVQTQGLLLSAIPAGLGSCSNFDNKKMEKRTLEDRYKIECIFELCKILSPYLEG